MGITAPLGILLALLGMVVVVLAIIFILVPIFRGIGWLIGGFFKGVGWLFAHIFEFIFGVIGDAIRFVGSIPVFAIFVLMAVLNVVIGRWSAAGHFSDSAVRETRIAGGCLYRIAIRRPLKLFYLHGLLEGVEERVPAALGGAPGRDTPSRRTGQFDGYTIVGSLRGGGSGGKLYVAEPNAEKRAAIPNIPDRVVIKSFALSDGSSLPQIVRESRALECARQLGHVVEHGMSDSRFFYVMPFIPGDHLGIVTRDLHARSDSTGLRRKELDEALSYVRDLTATLSAYHKGGFWHKDVKPENVIVHDGRAHLVDLGLVTALRSAMTLTTHGTEYFRDPEMVRQALRGVKVHQVDGAKFDIFAAGAVLYFMLENTFPAHGGLSAFQKRSPEALHWIVRRAMAEYHQRYDSAEMMLADLHYVASAADPWKVKPVELPSMKGAEIPDIPINAPDPARVATAAGTPRPPKQAPGDEGNRDFEVIGVAGGVDHGKPFVKAGQFHADETGGKPPRLRRPRLRVTNWWTGEYEVEDAGAAVGGAVAQPGKRNDAGGGLAAAPALSAHEAMQASRLEMQRAGFAAGGRSAREQLQSARRRAEQARRRASKHRTGRARSERQPGPALVFFSLLFLAAIFAGIMLLLPLTQYLDRDGARVTAPLPAGATARGTLLILNRHEQPESEYVEHQVDSLRAHYDRKGYDVVTPADLPDLAFGDSSAAELFDQALADWEASSGKIEHSRISDLLEAYDLAAVLRIRGSDPRRVEPLLIHSQPRDVDSASADGRAIVVNDVPSRNADELSDEASAELARRYDEMSVVQNEDLAERLRELIGRAYLGDEDAERQIDRLLDRHGAATVVWLEPASDDPAAGFVTHVHRRGESFRDGVASDTPVPHAGGGRLILVNDHPNLVNPRVRERVQQVRAFYRSHGFEIVDDVQAEAELRVPFDVFRLSPSESSREDVASILEEHDLDGVVYIESGGSPADVRIVLIELGDLAGNARTGSRAHSGG